MKRSTFIIKPIAMAMMLLIGSPVGFAATVIENPFAWNCSLNDETSGSFNIEWYTFNIEWYTEAFGVGASAWIDVMGSFVSDGYHVTMTAEGGFPESIGNWVEAEYGTRVDASTTRNQSRYFLRGPFDGDNNAEIYDVSVELDDITYLAFCGEILSGDGMYNLARTGIYLYGWVSLTVDENGIPQVTGSAIDLDGGPMVVGGGAWEGGIPEPSGCILLLIGVAVLGLRRVKKSKS